MGFGWCQFADAFLTVSTLVDIIFVSVTPGSMADCNTALSITAPCGLGARFVIWSFEILRFISVSDVCCCCSCCCCGCCCCCCILVSLNGFDKPTEPGNIVGFIDVSALVVLTTDADDVIVV